MANCSLVTVSSNICIKPFASAMKLPETSILPVGVSRTDMYFNETFNQKCRDNFFSQYPEARNKRSFSGLRLFVENTGLPVFMDWMMFWKLRKNWKIHIISLLNCILIHRYTQKEPIVTFLPKNCFRLLILSLPIILPFYLTPWSISFHWFSLPRIWKNIWTTEVLSGLPHTSRYPYSKEEQLVKVLSDEARLNSSVNQKYHDFFQTTWPPATDMQPGVLWIMFQNLQINKR